jgi:hydroxyacylglutathione hydrolase
MWSVAPVAGTYDATAWIHPADRHLLTDPVRGLSPESAARLLGGRYTIAEPDYVRDHADWNTLQQDG